MKILSLLNHFWNSILKRTFSHVFSYCSQLSIKIFSVSLLFGRIARPFWEDLFNRDERNESLRTSPLTVILRWRRTFCFIELRHSLLVAASLPNFAFKFFRSRIVSYEISSKFCKRNSTLYKDALVIFSLKKMSSILELILSILFWFRN